MKRGRTLAIVTGCAFLLAACGSGGGGATASSVGGSGDAVASASGAASGSAAAIGPITVQPEASNAVEQLIGPEGGSITAKAADGSTFTLTVPMGALPSDTTVTATPATLGGVDFPTYTVLFGPTGTQFLDWASLAITPSNVVPAKDQFLYQLTDDGSAFGAAFGDPKATTPTILLDHFSGYGLAQATDAQQSAMLSQAADTAQAKLQSEMADLFGKERQSQLTGTEGDPDFQSKLEDLFKQYEEQVLQPRLAAAGGSCEAMQTAVQSVLGYERQRQLLGLESSSNVDAMAVLNDSLNANGGPCEKEAIEKCKAAKDPGILLRFWLGLERQRQLLGAAESGAGDVSGMIKKARAICAPKAYEASGEIPSEPGGIQLKGLICSLAEPFSLKMSGDIIGRMRFTPSSDQAGSVNYKGVVANASFDTDGTGDYTVTYDDSQALATQIDFNLDGVIHIPVVGDTHGGGPGTVTLTPTEPCAEQQ